MQGPGGMKQGETAKSSHELEGIHKKHVIKGRLLLIPQHAVS
jgi:hypothetical protein